MKAKPFGNTVPVGFYVQQCADIFGKEIQMSVNRTNIINGGLDLQMTRAVFPNGSIDPWHALAMTTNANGNANVAIYINSKNNIKTVKKY